MVGNCFIQVGVITEISSASYIITLRHRGTDSFKRDPGRMSGPDEVKRGKHHAMTI